MQCKFTHEKDDGCFTDESYLSAHIFCSRLVPHVAVPSGALPEGLLMIRDFVSEEDEQVLLQCVDWDSQDSQISEGIFSC